MAVYARLLCLYFLALIFAFVNGFDSNIAFFDGKCFCQHECIHIDNGFICRCHQGYHLAGDGFSCIEDLIQHDKQPSNQKISSKPSISSSQTVSRKVVYGQSETESLSNFRSPKTGDSSKSSSNSDSIHRHPVVKLANLNSAYYSDDASVDSRQKLEALSLIQHPTCLDTGCENNGTCISQGSRSKCNCPLGTGGETCQKDIKVKYPKFHGDGYLALPVLKHAHKEFDIVIEFKPRDWNGILLYTAEREEGKGDYFSVALVNGFIVYRFDCGTGHATIRSANRVQLDKWNWVRVSRSDNLGSLWLNDVGPSTGYSQGAYSRITIRLELYLGGFFNVSGISRRTGISKGFIGCIQTLKINNYQYDLRSTENNGEAQHGVNIGECSEDVCKGVLCQNGGTCVPKSADIYVCLCPLGSSGNHCQEGKEVHIPKFSGFSHLRHPGLGRSSLSYTQIEMVFKPTHPEGVILYNGYTTDRKGDYISLAMRGRHLEFQFDLGTGPGVIKSFEPLVLDQWHWVQVSRTGMQGVMEIDKQHRVEGLSQGAFTQLTLTQDLLIGGHHNFDETSKMANLTSSFRGCIQSIIINDKELDLVDDADFGVNIEPCDHPCVGDPCLNSGQCLPDKEFYTCSCPLGFGGSNCQNEIREPVQVPSFNGHGYLVYSDDDVGKRLSGPVTDIQMRFRTTSPSGLLFWTGQNTSVSAPSDFLALGFTDGALQFRYNLGGGEVVISYNGSNLVDGQWHSIRAQRDKQDGYLEVDHRWIVEGSSPGKFSVLNTNKELYLGGALDTSLLTFGKFLTGFAGCISDVKLAEEYNINLVKGAHSGRNIQSCDIT